MDIRGTKTQENLLRAFNVESEAKNKYEIYAAKAKKDGYEQIAALFLETARNEYAHSMNPLQNKQERRDLNLLPKCLKVL